MVSPQSRTPQFPSILPGISFRQKFATLNGMKTSALADFVRNEMPGRMLGNCGVLLCGETNGVRYSPEHHRVSDTYGLRQAFPADVQVILNPIHDRMTRFEMKDKRRFLSADGRWVVSVWNKGKRFKDGKTRDGDGPPWAVYHDGVEQHLKRIENPYDVEIGVLEM